MQSIVGGLPWREPLVLRRAGAMLAHSRELILDCGDGVRLQGLLSRQPYPASSAKPPLAVLIHGWEGCADSLYCVSAGGYLFDRGFDVFRLNLRDHGATHHLNAGLFHSCRLGEAIGAIKAIEAQSPGQPLYLAGFSLGGNFALRVAARAAGVQIETVVACCPVLEPEHSLQAMERRGARFYHAYFLRRWRRSLYKKARLYPALYDYPKLARQPTLRALTDHLVRRYTEFPQLESYLQGYAVTGKVLAGLSIPCHLILAADDPIIPACDRTALAAADNLSITLAEHGGHCGFLVDHRLHCWLDGKIHECFQAA